MIRFVDFGSVNAVNLAITMETEVPIELAEYESLESDSDGLNPGMLTATTAVRVLSPDEMIGIKWWLEEWYLEWKTLANIKNDTDFLNRSQKTSNLKFGSDDMIKSLPLHPNPNSKSKDRDEGSIKSSFASC
jgi:hypothetical protein